VKITICLVTYNGARHIARQLNSILSQTYLPNEIIVVDDNSNDGTIEVVLKILTSSKIPHLIIENVSRLGINKTFERCLSLAKSEFIMISDQDDFWFPSRLDNIVNYISKNPSFELILVNAIIERNGSVTKEEVSDYYPYTTSVINNFIKNRFTGCQIIIRKSLLLEAFPFPEDVVCFYDHWISMLALINNSTHFIIEPQGLYCRHASTVTDLNVKRIFFRIIKSRFILLTLLIRHLIRKLLVY
jgi:glycosyltransferase involved in cell wall biosynthesis